MTSSWLRWCLNIGLASSLAMGGVIASSADYALSKNTSDGTRRTERSVTTPKNVIQGSAPDALKDQDSRPEYRLVVQSLHCHSTDAGGTNPDQVSLYVKNQLVWGLFPMSAGTQVDLTTVEGTLFKNTVPIKIHAGSKVLGPRNISSVPGGESNSITFTNVTASYTLTYQTIPDFEAQISDFSKKSEI